MRIKGLAALFALVFMVAGCGDADAGGRSDAGAPAGEVVPGATDAGSNAGTADSAGVDAVSASRGSETVAPGGAGATGTGAGSVSGGRAAGAVGASGATAGAVDPRAGSRGGDAGNGGDPGSGARAAGGSNEAGGNPPVAEDALSEQQQAAILRATAERYRAIRSMQAQFEMLYENRLLRSRVTSRGTLYQRRPDRILLDFSDPEGDILLGDGTYFWAYYPSVDRAQAIRTPQAHGSAGVDLQAQFVGDPIERFEHEYDGVVDVDGRRTHAFTLTPREPTDYTQLKVWIDAQDSLVRQFEFTDATGAVRRIKLTGLQLNPTLDDARFRFVTPAGVRVVDRG